MIDGARWLAGGRLSLTPLADLLTMAAPGRVEALGARLDAAAPWTAQLSRLVLATPAFAALAALAALLLVLAQPPRDALDALGASRGG
ncbi:MAG: hypothetical protein HZY79_04170 [Rhodoblastus sp.]|nr:MAG: hypothetical protein HZY79_04170 [Rhodoblastus sp.]